MSSTGHIYHRAAKRRGDKFDRLMTRGKLLDNDTQLFIYISILIMTQLHQRHPKKQTTEPILGTALLGKKSYNRSNGKAWLRLLPVWIYREIMPSSCPLTRGKESSHIRISDYLSSFISYSFPSCHKLGPHITYLCGLFRKIL